MKNKSVKASSFVLLMKVYGSLAQKFETSFRLISKGDRYLGANYLQSVF